MSGSSTNVSMDTDLAVEHPVPARSAFCGPRPGRSPSTQRLPEGALIDVETISGRVTATGYLGGVRAKTTSGNVSSGSVGGDLVVSSMSGDFTVDSVTGGTEVATTSACRLRGSRRNWLRKNGVGEILTSVLENGPRRSRRHLAPLVLVSCRTGVT